MDLFDPPSVPSGASREAAVRVKRTGRAAALRTHILALLTAAGETGLTRHEIETALGESGDSVRPRIWECMRCNPPLIRQSDDRRAMRGHGPSAVLYLASPTGSTVR